ncbi:MAG TPA: hypothetical protein VNT30_19050 [Stellaceae bacterium]|nr:hypothetical protein [Stellaceae bacterium]
MMALPLLHGRRAVAIGLLACGILCGGWGLANVKTAMGSHRFVVLRPDAVASGGNLGLTPRAMADQSPSVLAKP